MTDNQVALHLDSADHFSAPNQVEVRIPDEAEAFAKANGLKNQLQTAIALAKKSFSSLQSLQAGVVQDPDSDDKWVALKATLTGTVDDILAAYNSYSSEWVHFVSSPARFMIRLSVNFI
jgi:hypothetical protein